MRETGGEGNVKFHFLNFPRIVPVDIPVQTANISPLFEQNQL
jgi:hypothetical protein